MCHTWDIKLRTLVLIISTVCTEHIYVILISFAKIECNLYELMELSLELQRVNSFTPKLWFLSIRHSVISSYGRKRRKRRTRCPEITTRVTRLSQRSALGRASSWSLLSSLNKRAVPCAYDACTRDTAAYAVRVHTLLVSIEARLGDRGDGVRRDARDVTSGARAPSVGTGGRCVRESAKRVE